jgi:hypothetical protein
MILVGASWVLFWFLVKIFSVELLTATLVTGVAFILLGLVLGERPVRK